MTVGTWKPNNGIELFEKRNLEVNVYHINSQTYLKKILQKIFDKKGIFLKYLVVRVINNRQSCDMETIAIETVSITVTVNARFHNSVQKPDHTKIKEITIYADALTFGHVHTQC